MSHYECDGCGACCRTYPIFASGSDAVREPRIAAEGRKLADHLATPEWAYQLFPLPFHRACCFLDESARCTIYEARPDVCRAFAAGGDQCQAARARAGLPPLAPVARGGCNPPAWPRPAPTVCTRPVEPKTERKTENGKLKTEN